MQSLFRRLTHDALSVVFPSKDRYWIRWIKNVRIHGDCKKTAASMTVLNLDAHAQPDVFADLEQPLPFADRSFDTVLAMNVLEHVYRYEQLLRESFRVLRSGGGDHRGSVLFQVHPSQTIFSVYA